MSKFRITQLPNCQLPNYQLLITLLILLAAFALRIYLLDAQSIWWDEGISLNLARSPIGAIFADRVRNIHPPLYFVLLRGWTGLTGLNIFSARYLSVLASWLQLAVMFTFMRLWLGRERGWRTAVIAMLLVAVSPLSVIYGQETRVYAMLPLVYLGLLGLTFWLVRPSAAPRWYHWVLLGLGEWIGLHLHYLTLFVVAFINIWAVLVYWRGLRRGCLRYWLLVQVGVGAASLPWFTAVLLNLAAVTNEANAGALLTDPVPLDFLLSQVWVFHLTGLAGSLAVPLVRWLAGATAVFLLLLWLWAVKDKGMRRTAVWLALVWLVPVSSALFVWSVRSFSHPRYISMYAIGLIPLAAFLLGARYANLARQALTGLLAFGLTAISLLGLWYYFVDPAFAKDDMRGAARYLETAASSDDLIIAPDAGWALEFEYDGDAPVTQPGLDSGEAWAATPAWTDRPRRVFTLSPAAGDRDWQGFLPFVLEQSGQLTAVTRFDGLILREYLAEQPVAPPAFDPIFAQFGLLQLTGVWVEQDAAADTAVTLALQWRLTEPATDRFGVSLQLADGDGWPLAQKDRLLVDERGFPTDLWPVNQPVVTYHVLPIPPGTPPLTYRLNAGVYRETADGISGVEWQDETGAPQGQQITLAEELRLAPGTAAADNLYQLPPGLPPLPRPEFLADGLTLTAVGLDRGEAAPGQAVTAVLVWQAEKPLPDMRPRLELWQGDQLLAAADGAPAQGRYPTNRWQAGEQVVEHRRLVVPPEAESGTAVVFLALGDKRVEVGQVNVTAEARQFAPPPAAIPLDVVLGDTARLVGFDPPPETVPAGEPIPLTLYWQSLRTGETTAYTVFTHLLSPDGRLLAQHDAPPDNGRRPITGWLAGEYVTDPHLLTFRDLDYAGPAQLSVGLYDPATGERLVGEDGRDAIMLPFAVRVGK